MVSHPSRFGLSFPSLPHRIAFHSASRRLRSLYLSSCLVWAVVGVVLDDLGQDEDGAGATP